MTTKQSGIQLTACAAALTIVFPVVAQEAPTKSDSAITEVIVTASKRKESIQAVPMSMDAITAQQLQKQNILKFEELEKLSPGLVLNPSDGRGQNVSLRGVTFNPDSGTSPSVQIYWNETPIGTSDAFRGMFDVARVEVLRGPQGTLRGQTSPAGSITITTERPDLNDVTGRVIQTLGSRHLLNTQAAVNVPLIAGKLALRVAGLNGRSENGVHNVTNGAVNQDRDKGARVSLLYQPTKELEVLLVHQQLISHNTNYQLNIGVPAPGQGNGPVLAPGDLASVADGNFKFYNKSKLTSLNVTWDLGSHKLSYVGGFQQGTETDDRDLDIHNVIPGWAQQQVVSIATLQRTHELRFESTGTRFWNYMVGAYYAHLDSPVSFTQPLPYYFPAPYQTPLFAPVKGYSAPGAFSQGTALFTNHRFALTENDQLELGYRFQKNRTYGQQYIDTFGTIMAAMPDEKAHRESTARTGSASYRHNFSKLIMGYVSYGTAYRPGGIVPFVTSVGLSPDLISYKPEKSRSMELGVKSTIFDRRLVVNADVFQQNIKDYISRANTIYDRVAAVAGEPNGPGPGGGYPSVEGSNLNTNGDVLIRGLEATAIWNILPNWRAQLSASYVDAHYDNALLYCNDGNNDGVPDNSGAFVQPGRQVSVCRSNRPLADIFGNEAGKFNMMIQSEYSRNLGSVDGFVRVLGRHVAAGYNLALAQQISSFNPIDLYVGIREPSQKWELSLWSQNLLDRSSTPVPNKGFVGGVSGGYRTIGVPQERKVGVTLRYDFGI